MNVLVTSDYARPFRTLRHLKPWTVAVLRGGQGYHDPYAPVKELCPWTSL